MDSMWTWGVHFPLVVHWNASLHFRPILDALFFSIGKKAAKCLLNSNNHHHKKRYKTSCVCASRTYIHLARGGYLVQTMPGCVCPKVKDMGPFSASRE